MTYLNIPPSVVSVLDPLRPSPRLYAQIMGPFHGPLRDLARRIANPFPPAVLKALTKKAI